jgi:hypothetical protein
MVGLRRALHDCYRRSTVGRWTRVIVHDPATCGKDEKGSNEFDFDLPRERYSLLTP